MKPHAGFTLIEVLIAMVVSLVVIGGAYAVFNSQQKQTTIQTNISDAQQTLRGAMDFMCREVRMAGYDPTSTRKFGIIDIKQDSDDMSAISFSLDANGDGTLDNNETYRYSIADMPIGAPNGTIDLARAAGGSGRQLLATNITTLGLAYAYDNNGDGQLDRDAAGEVIWAVDDGNTESKWNQLQINQTAKTVTSVATGTKVDTRTIRAVRIWMLSQSHAPDPNYIDATTYLAGPHVVQPNNNFRHRLLERTILCRNMGL